MQLANAAAVEGTLRRSGDVFDMTASPTAGSALGRLFATSVLAVVLGVGCGSGSESEPNEAAAMPEAPGVSFLDYSPKPFSKDMEKMTVRFTTTAPAGPGLEYAPLLLADEDRDQNCFSEHGTWDDGVPGEAGKTYELTIDTQIDEGRPCIGRALLAVHIQEVDDPGRGGAFYRKMELQILPPRSG